MENYVYPEECLAIIDVTKAPYYIDNTGKHDCTKQLCALVDDILGAYLTNFYETKAKLESMDDPDAIISFEIRKVQGKLNVVFPEILPDSKIIYFPNGTYLVSDTVSYSFEEFRNILGGVPQLEMNCQLRFMGQSRDGVIIKLQDRCRGFEFGNDRPVIDFMRGEQSNIAMTNMFENITIDIGSGNPGATGLRYFANNTGAIRNVKIISSDPEYRGNTGLSVIHSKVSACYAKNIEIIGFNYGVKVMSNYLYTTFEHITLKHQRRSGFYIGNNLVAIRDLYSENSVSAVKIDGMTAYVVLTDAVLVGGNPMDDAIRHCFGHMMLRNIRSEGYEHLIKLSWSDEPDKIVDDYLEEFCTYGPKTLFEHASRKSLNLPVLETPDASWDPPEDWVSVNSFGAVGDGITDDTAAIQKALRSGKSTVYFNPGRYLINDVIEIPATVHRVNFMYSDIFSGSSLAAMRNTGAFIVREHSEEPLVIEDLFAWEKFKGFMTFVEHACKRTLILSDIHIQAASIYFNTVPGGKVFMENTGCTIGGIPGAGARSKPLPNEDWTTYDRQKPCFYFYQQEVYCRQLNPERSLHEVINDGGTLWVLGGKTEEEGTAYETRNGGFTEILGIIFGIGLGKDYPAIINDNSNVSAYATTFGMHKGQYWPVAVREIQGTDIRHFTRYDMPVWFMESYGIPLYIGTVPQ